MDVLVVDLFRLRPKNSHEEIFKQEFSMGVHLIPLEWKYEAILCLFPLEIVLTGPVEELAEDMLEAGGKPEHLGLGKPRAFLAVGRLGGHCPTRSNQFLIQTDNKQNVPLA